MSLSLSLVWRNLTAHALRSMLTALAIALGVGMVLGALVVGQTANQAVGALAQPAGNAPGLPQPASNADAASATRALLQGGLAMVGSIMFFAAAFVMLNAFAMSVTARTQELGALRALGMTRGQATRLMLVEALIIGLAGAGLGLCLGLGLAWGSLWMLGTLKSSRLVISAGSVAFSLGAGLVSALVGAWLPARQAGQVSPLVALRASPPPAEHSWYVRHGARAGLAILAPLLPALAAIALLLKPAFLPAIVLTLLGIIGALIGTILLLPALVSGLARSLRPVLVRWLGAEGRLAADNLVRNKQRAVLTAGALMAVFAMLIGTSSLIPLMMKGGLRGFTRMMKEDIFVWPDLTAEMTSGKFTLANAFQRVTEWQLPPGTLEALSPLLQTGQAQAERVAFALVPPEIATYAGGRLGAFVDIETYLQQGNFDFFVGDRQQALDFMRRGRGILLGLTPAGQLNVTVGDTVKVNTPHGEVEFTVAGIGGTGFMMPIFSYADGETYFDVKKPAWLGLYVPPDKTVAEVLPQVRQSLQPIPGLMILGGQLNTGADALFGAFDRFLALLNALLLLAVFVAALGVVNTMVINVAERRKEIALLRAVGATQRQVRRVIVAEAALLGFIAALIAIVVSIFMVGLFALLMTPGGTPSLGIRVTWDLAAIALEVGLSNLALYGTLALVLGPLAAALAAYYPAKQAAALDVVEATRSEQVALRPAQTRRPEHGPEARRPARSSFLSWRLAWRQMLQHRTRTVLSALAVALGAAMTLAADVISQSILAIMTRNEDIKTLGAGLFGQMDTFMGLIGVGVALAAGFMVFNAFLMSATQRRRQVGALRALGMTRSQVMQLMFAEAILIGGAGTLAGLAFGYPLAWGLLALLKAFGGPMFSASGQGMASAGMIALAAGLGLGSTLLAMLLPAWRVARISPLEALREPASITTTPQGRRLGQIRALAGAGLCLALMIYLAAWLPGRRATPPLDLPLTAAAMLLWLAGLGLMLPASIGLLGALSRRPLQRWLGAAGRLMADNLARPAARARVLLTVLTLAVGLTLTVALTGGLTFLFKELFGPGLRRTTAQPMVAVMTFDYQQGVAGFANAQSMRLPPEAGGELRQAVGALGQVLDWNFVMAPEIAFIPNYFSFLIRPDDLAAAHGWTFKFNEGDWEHAQPLLQKGCSVFLSPMVARNNHVSLYGHLTLAGKKGPVDCVVAGIGQPMVNASIISGAGSEAFENTDPMALIMLPAAGVSVTQLEVAAQPVVARHKLNMQELGEKYLDLYLSATNQVGAAFDALLLLAILAAALGVVNTTYMSVTERQRELGLLRAVGATRGQVTQAVVGEAALMGVAGGLIGLAAGLGLTIILPTVYGGNAWGSPDMDVWAAAGRSAQPALAVGAFGLVAAPIVCALAAWQPVRSILRGSALHTLEPEQLAGGAPAGPEPRPAMSHLGFLTLRNLSEARTRTVLSALAVALGVAVVAATGVFISGTRAGWTGGENKMAFLIEFSNMAFYAVGALLLVAAGFLIYNALAMSVAQRRRQIGMLRSLGMTRRQVLDMVLWEAAFTGGLGTLLGLGLGPLLGNTILAVLRQMGMQAGRGEVGWANVLLALGMGLGITLLSALGPARSAAQLTPLTALRDAAPSERRRRQSAGRRAIAGALLVAGLTLYLIIAPPGQWTGYHSPWDWIMSFGLWAVWLVGLFLLTPWLLAGAVRILRRLLSRLGGNMGRLTADNLARSPERVALMVLTFGVGLMTLVGAGGEIGFLDGVLVTRVAETLLHQTTWRLTPFDPKTGVAQINAYSADAPGLGAEVVTAARRLTAGRAEVSDVYIVSAPEIGSPMPGFPSVILSDPNSLARPGNFKLVEGDWTVILPLLKGNQCAAVVSPAVAANQGANVGGTISVTGPHGMVAVRVAGIGSGGVPPMAVMGLGCKAAFVAEGKSPDALTVRPQPGAANADVAALEKDLFALKNRYPGQVFVSLPEDELHGVLDTEKQLMLVLNGMVMMGIVGAALGMINTTLVSVLERRRELGLLRAVGAGRRQIVALVMGEAALIGLLGAGLGTLAGIGMGAIFALAYGGATFGLVDLPLRWAAAQTVWPALLNGWPGIVAAPLLAALAAYPAAVFVLRGSAVETLEPERQARLTARRAVAGWLSRGSLPVRFALGTAALLTLVLVGLLAVVLTHTRTRLEETTSDALRRMVSWNAGMLELALPQNAQALDLKQLQAGAGSNFDADTLLRFQTLMDEMTQNGVVDYAIVDSDNITLLSLDSSQIGATAPPLKTPAETTVVSDQTDDGRRLMRAAAPVRNQAGAVLGSVRLDIEEREIENLLARLRNTLAGLGAIVVGLGVLASVALAAPLAQVTRQLAAHAAEIGRGSYSLFKTPMPRAPRVNLSLRTRLTIVLTLISAALVGLLEWVTIPIEQTYLEKTMKDTLLAGAQWIGDAMSESLGSTLSNVSLDQLATIDATAFLGQTVNLGRLQELTEQVRSTDMAYMALVNRDGDIVFSDQLALVGETAPVANQTRVEAAVWRNQEVWVISTPIRRGRSGEQLGALRLAVRRQAVTQFLDESRNLFQLTGLIAILAAILLAQAVGGAVAAPASQLAAGTRRVAQGDLNVRFRVDSRDELAQLASAYNQMVAGLQEREWLRDMFGRFVSQEVAEAIRQGQVKLAGEHRVVSVLFCDIRDFTGFSERHTPEQVVAMLNDYLPVVVEAAQQQGGTVNKFGGDSTLVIYGAPRPIQESAYHAVLTALAMRAGLEKLNARLTGRGEAPLRIGVGINTGMALAGAVGPQARQEYTVIGDTVNLASRIEALNKQYPQHDILISQWTYEALGSRRAEFDLLALGQVPIRGKSGEVSIWSVQRSKTRAVN